MPFGTRFCRIVAALLTCGALLTGCAAGRSRQVHLPRMNFWPQAWPRPTIFSRPNQQDQPHDQPQYQPVPADPSGSPYPPNSTRGLYVPTTPAPGSRLGLPVPPPLPPDDVTAPAPESQQEALPIPPAAEDMDVSFDSRRPGRSTVIPPPPPELKQTYVPRLAERTDPHDRQRQPVNLDLPEADLESDVPTEAFPADSSPGRSPVEAFPQPRQADENLLEHGPGQSMDLDTDDEPSPTEIDPSVHRSGTLRRGRVPSPPRLREPDEADLAFPAGNRQMSGERRDQSVKLDTGVSRLGIERFRLTRDARSGNEATVLSARKLQRGKGLVVQTDIVGLEKMQRTGELVSRVTCHVEIRDTRKKVVYRTDDHSATEVTAAVPAARHVAQWLTIPNRLNAGDYVLQLHVRDDIARQQTVVEMPVTIR